MAVASSNLFSVVLEQLVPGECTFIRVYFYYMFRVTILNGFPPQFSEQHYCMTLFRVSLCNMNPTDL